MTDSSGTLVRHDLDQEDLTEIFNTVSHAPRGAVLSADDSCRFLLWRNWSDRPHRRCTIIGLNPSTADANVDDPTIRRCIDFAKKWSCDGLLMVNVFATRSTDPLGIVVGREAGVNSLYLRAACNSSTTLVAAWGANKAVGNHWRALGDHVDKLLCLGHNMNGSPKHPLYVAGTTPLVAYAPKM